MLKWQVPPQDETPSWYKEPSRDREKHGERGRKKERGHTLLKKENVLQW